MTKIYGVTGMPLAGKTTVADILEEEGFTVLDMGDVVRTEMEKRDLDVEQTGEFATSMRDRHGMDAMAKLSMPYLEEILDEKDRVVITGMRSWDEKRRFEDEIGEDIEMVAVWASREIRRNRMDERAREEDLKGDSFEERDFREAEYGAAKLIGLSDHLIKNNDSSLEELREKVKQLVN